MNLKKILIVVATELEKRGISKVLNSDNLWCEFLVSGIGIANTTFSLSQHLLHQKYDLVINAGIAGSYTSEIKIGDVVMVEQDCFADLGAETEDGFLSALEAGFLTQGSKYLSTYSENHLHFRTVKGATVNMVSGTEKRAKLIAEKYNVEIESMEGAAIFMVCNKLNVPVVQIRSISNMAGDRDKNNWDIALALENLRKEIDCWIARY